MKYIQTFILLTLFSFTVVTFSCAKEDLEIRDRYLLIRDDLFEKNGQLFFRGVSAAPLDEGLDNQKFVFLEHFLFEDQILSTELKSLDQVIDKTSWKKLSSSFYRDKDNLFCYHNTTDGGFLVHMEWVIVDKFQIYETTSDQEELLGAPGAIEQAYSTDGRNLFYYCQVVDGIDLDSFKLLKRSDTNEWDGEDRRYFISSGRKHLKE